MYSPLCVPHHLLLLHDSPGFGSGAGLADDPHTLLQGYRGHRPCKYLQINDILTPTLCSMQYSHSILETIKKKDHKILKMNLEVFLEQVGETLCVYNDSYYKHTVVLNIVVILKLGTKMLGNMWF